MADLSVGPPIVDDFEPIARGVSFEEELNVIDREKDAEEDEAAGMPFEEEDEQDENAVPMGNSASTSKLKAPSIPALSFADGASKRQTLTAETASSMARKRSAASGSSTSRKAMTGGASRVLTSIKPLNMNSNVNNNAGDLTSRKAATARPLRPQTMAAHTSRILRSSGSKHQLIPPTPSNGSSTARSLTKDRSTLSFHDGSQTARATRATGSNNHNSSSNKENNDAPVERRKTMIYKPRMMISNPNSKSTNKSLTIDKAIPIPNTTASSSQPETARKRRGSVMDPSTAAVHKKSTPTKRRSSQIETTVSFAPTNSVATSAAADEMLGSPTKKARLSSTQNSSTSSLSVSFPAIVDTTNTANTTGTADSIRIQQLELRIKALESDLDREREMVRRERQTAQQAWDELEKCQKAEREQRGWLESAWKDLEASKTNVVAFQTLRIEHETLKEKYETLSQQFSYVTSKHFNEVKQLNEIIANLRTAQKQ